MTLFACTFNCANGPAMIRFLLLLVAFSLCGSTIQARELKLATWNLGWHISQAEAADWISKCGALFEKNPTTGLFEPTGSASGKPGWLLKWGRDAPIVWDIAVRPPCDVFQSNHKIVPVTPDAYAKRASQIQAFIAANVAPDIIAFQEVSGEQAVREVLPNSGSDYSICSFSTFKVQRLAIAWKKELGTVEECATQDTLTLPNVDPKDRIRPGLSLALRIDGQLVRILSVHLKSSCVSPLEPGDKGALAGASDACTLLQQQVAPIEQWIEQKTADTGLVVMMGDFNRNLWHERHAGGDVRTDHSDPIGLLPAGVKVNSLIGEVDDGAPAGSLLTLLKEACPVNPFSTTACENAESQVLANNDAQALSGQDNLGCRNAVGLDHILIGPGLTADKPAEKVALGKMGRNLPANDAHPNPLLALSDHCPLVAAARF